MSTLSKQVGGSHYKTVGVQHVMFCMYNGIPWCESCATKYIARHKRKNGLEDIRKAIHYLELLNALIYQAEQDKCKWYKKFCRNNGAINTDFLPERMDPAKFVIPIDVFLKDNDIDDLEAVACKELLSHQVGDGEVAVLRAIGALRKIEESYLSNPDHLLS